MIGQFIKGEPVTIYGAGIAGLTLAARLKKLNIDFTLYEKSNPGGKISSQLSPYGPMEAAASILYVNAEVEKLLHELGLNYIPAQKKLKRWIWSPTGPEAVFSLGLLARIMTRGLKKFPLISVISTVEDIFFPLLGRKYTDELLSCSLQGIYACEARELHFLSLFPWAQDKSFSSYLDFFIDLKKEMKRSQSPTLKGSVSFHGGMQVLTDRLTREVQDHIRPAPAEFTPTANTVLCTTAGDAARLLKSTNPVLARELEKIEYTPISSYTFFLKEDLPQLKKSFGMLIPQKYHSPILGIIHPSDIFPENYSAKCYTVICKGLHSVSQVQDELEAKLSGFRRDQILHDSLRSWQEGLPRYNLARAQALDQIRGYVRHHPGLIFFGNYTNGISLRSLIEQTNNL